MILSQRANLCGTYMFEDKEYLQIYKDSFKIIRTSIGLSEVDLNNEDSIIAIGHFEDCGCNFIRLFSINNIDFKDKITFKEYVDSTFKDDSIQLVFNFPFKGILIIRAGFIGIPSKKTESNRVVIPKRNLLTDELYFEIKIEELKTGYYNENYLGKTSLPEMPYYRFANPHANSLEISIPFLDNSFFARYVILGEYLKIDNKSIAWRNRKYRKVSKKIIYPSIKKSSVQDIDDPSGVDIISTYK